ncbi:MAG: thioesterase, partial [Oscillospiraceae bacterium]
MGLIDEGRKCDKHATVAYYECDFNGRMTISSLLKRIQQISMEHCDLLGLGHEVFQSINMVFMLARLTMEIKRYPKANEKIVLITTPAEKPVKAQYKRTTVIINQDTGEELVLVDARWVLCNLGTGRIEREKPNEIEFPKQNSEDFELDMKMPKKDHNKFVSSCKHTVRYSNMDINKHLNNTVYADIICNAIPYSDMAEKEIKKVMVSYKNQGLYGDELVVTVNSKD